MYHYDENSLPERPRPKTLTVLMLLVSAAAAFSYLRAYAFTEAMVGAHLLAPSQFSSDPRPKWMATSFAMTMTVFLLVGMFTRWLSYRQLRRIDSMADAEERAQDRFF